jgi:hypothetical protein
MTETVNSCVGPPLQGEFSLQTQGADLYFKFLMNRIVTAIFAILGILAMSMPGDTCFLWACLGVDHHHHDSAESVEQDTPCFHEHDCTKRDEEPDKPCGSGEDTVMQAGSGIFKLNSQLLPTGTDCSHDWTKTPEASTDCAISNFVSAILHGNLDALPPPAEIRLCRFLI